jgi:hypothetical protein
VAFKTTNGGTSYTPITTGITNKHEEVFFVTDQLGFVVEEFGQIRKTIDGGNTWTILNGSGMGITLQVYFTDILNGYTVNDDGAVFRTTDGGTTFTLTGQTCLQTPYDMQFINDSTGFVVGSNVNASCDVSYTTDYGQTWNSMIFPYENAVYGVFAFDTTNIYLAGSNQTIIRTSVDGVVTSNHKTQLKDNLSFKLYPNPSNGIFIIESSTNAETNVEVFDIAGRLVFQNSYNNKQTELDLTSYSNGLYLVKLNSERQSATFKISKQ